MMLRILLFVVIIAAVQCMEVKEKLNAEPVTKYQPPARQEQRLDGFRPRSDWSHYFPSWSNYFKDDDDVEESPSVLKRLAAVERVVKELNDLLKKESIGSKRPASPTTPNNKVQAASPCKDSPPKTSTDKQPEKTEMKPDNDDKPAQPEKVTEASETVDKTKKPNEAAATTEDKNSSKEPLPAGNGEETAPQKGEEKQLKK